EGGFTLIELLVVIIIIGILAAIAIPVFLNQRKKGYDAQAKSDLRNAATAEETYLTDNPAGYTSDTNGATLGAYGFKHSPNVNEVVVPDSANGYCEAATSSSGNTFWYDSQAGGLQSAPSATAPATTTCSKVTITAPAKP
ncbi:MAG TPA: prepilin-type N-terminal cleavage/methylation domain-containing protein, partial [Mycobacteriales bacterium]|nr:prepilin-type N-terminal cleavage/methylation domain-containing protein [Mycobacteriales bacterium]